MRLFERLRDAVIESGESKLDKVEPASYSERFLASCAEVLVGIDAEVLEKTASCVAAARSSGGKVFTIGLGGSASTASHFASDLRKLCEVDAVCLTDSASEFSAWVNDSGYEWAMADWLRLRGVGERDVVVAFSVGGGDVERGVSTMLVRAIECAADRGATTVVVSSRYGDACSVANFAIVAGSDLPSMKITFVGESVHLAVAHAIASHPMLMRGVTVW